VRSVVEPEVHVEYRTAVRVRYPETDRMGVVYHAHYLVWFELGRTELMRGLGCAYGKLEDEDGISFPVIAAGARYRAPARYDELLSVRTTLVEVGRARVRFEYRILREQDERLLVTGFTEHAIVGARGRPVRMPGELRRKLRGEGELR
jgi:acyl-CoA thioester hydrolase